VNRYARRGSWQAGSLRSWSTQPARTAASAPSPPTVLSPDRPLAGRAAPVAAIQGEPMSLAGVPTRPSSPSRSARGARSSATMRLRPRMVDGSSRGFRRQIRPVCMAFACVWNDLHPVTQDGRTGLKASARMSDSGQRVTMEPVVASFGATCRPRCCLSGYVVEFLA
jgi:hypothetical protein